MSRLFFFFHPLPHHLPINFWNYVIIPTKFDEEAVLGELNFNQFSGNQEPSREERLKEVPSLCKKQPNKCTIICSAQHARQLISRAEVAGCLRIAQSWSQHEQPGNGQGTGEGAEGTGYRGDSKGGILWMMCWRNVVRSWVYCSWGQKALKTCWEWGFEKFHWP